MKDGKPIKFGSVRGPSGVLATPVFHGNRVYVAVGQDPEKGSGDGDGCLNCIDPTKTGDISQSGLVWRVEQFERSLSTVAVADGLLYTCDFSGMVYCIDAASGKVCWKHDTQGQIWGSPLLADGKLYVGNEAGVLTVLTAAREEKVLAKINMDGAIYSSPVAANGVLYVSTDKYLYAIR